MAVIFISHINEEAKIAIALKGWIESSLIGQCDVFVSSDQDDIPAGSKWLDKINNALEEATVLIVLCSQNSLSRPWINFETGCGWIKGVPILPICHSGQRKASLPPPISMFQAVDVQESDFVDSFLSGLAKLLGFDRLPRIDRIAMRREILEACSHSSTLETIEEQKTNNTTLSIPVRNVIYLDLSEFDHGVREEPIDKFKSFDDLLDTIYINYLSKYVNSFSYGRQWFLRMSKTGKELKKAGRKDNRTLKELGLFPGIKLKATANRQPQDSG